MNDYALGIDVSKWNTIKSYPEIKKQGFKFGACRFTVGNYYSDPARLIHWQGFHDIELIKTGYHVHVPINTPQSQINNFSANVLSGHELAWIIDCEVNNNLSWNIIIDNLYELLQRFEDKFSHKPIIYTNQFFANDHLGFKYNIPDWINNYHWWIANYTTKAVPSLPKGVNTWKFWQYTNKGFFKNISDGNLDLNRFNGTELDLFKFIGLSQNKTLEERVNRLEELAIKAGWNL